MFGSRRRPDRKTLAALVRETGGNVTALSGRLGVSRQTVYTWVYQLGLERLVGIRSVPRREEADVGQRGMTARHDEAPVKPARPAPPAVAVTVRLSPETWKAVRIAAIELERTSSAVLEEAAQAWLARRP